MEQRSKNLIKNGITLFVVLFFTWVMYKNLGDFETLFETISNAHPLFFILTVGLGISNFYMYSWIAQSSYRIISEGTKYPKIFLNTIVYHFLSVSNPLGAAGSSAYLVKYLVDRGLSHIKAVFGVLITNLSTNLAFIFILIYTLYNLNLADRLERYQWYASFIALALNLGILAIIILFVALPRFSGKIAKWVTGIINKVARKIIKRDSISERTLDDYIQEARSLSTRFDLSIYKFIKTLPISLFYHGVNMLILYLSFKTFAVPVEITQIVTLYGLITLFTIVAPTPQGVGVVEGLAHTVAISVGVSSSGALLAILMFRLAVIWFPALIGLFIFRHKDGALSDSQEGIPVGSV